MGVSDGQVMRSSGRQAHCAAGRAAGRVAGRAVDRSVGRVSPRWLRGCALQIRHRSARGAARRGYSRHNLLLGEEGPRLVQL